MGHFKIERQMKNGQEDITKTKKRDRNARQKIKVVIIKITAFNYL